MDNQNFTIHPVFPKPIYKTFLKKGLTKKEIDYVLNLKTRHQNQGNTNSANSYILNEKRFNKLKKELEGIVQSYVDNVICPKYLVKPYITQSWLNYTNPNEFHHRHNHPNSLISGVLYLKADTQLDSISFYNTQQYEAIFIERKSYNLFNSQSWKFPVEENQVILFPSDLTHQVDTKKGNNLRLSLAFNVFFKGKFGEQHSLTELILK